MTSQPLFILCGPRRGSTLLRYMLDTHSQIASPGEIKVGALCRHLEMVIRFTKGEPRYLLPAEDWTPFSLAETRETVDRILSAYATLKGKSLWCDKSIDNVHHMDLLAAVFPQARFVCLHRDSLDVVQSCLECSRNGFMEELAPYAVRQPDNLVAAMMAAWIEHTSQVLDFEQRHAERCLRVRYEELVTAPEATLRALLELAGLAWEEALLNDVFSRRHDQGGGDPKIQFATRIDTASLGSGQRINLASLPDSLRQAASALSARLGYPPLEAGRQLPWQAASSEPEPVPPGDLAGPSPAQFIEHFLPAGLAQRADLTAEIHGTCELLLQGEGGGRWQLAFTGGAPAVTSAAGGADCSIAVGTADFAAILAGQLNPMVALWDGQITLEGDTALAGQVAQLIHTLSREAAVP